MWFWNQHTGGTEGTSTGSYDTFLNQLFKNLLHLGEQMPRGLVTDCPWHMILQSGLKLNAHAVFCSANIIQLVG